MDVSCEELPPAGWRIAWIDGDPRLSETSSSQHYSCGPVEQAAELDSIGYICPEQTGRKLNCEECRYCFDGQKHDVIFLRH